MTKNSDTNAIKESSSNKNSNTNTPKAIFRKDIDSQVLQVIKEAFVSKEVVFEIPPKMKPDFDTKKQELIDELTEKMSTLKIDRIPKIDITNLVNQKFQYFINRVKYYQMFTWVQTVLSNIKKDDKNSVKSSSVNVPDSLKKFADNPPYLKTQN